MSAQNTVQLDFGDGNKTLITGTVIEVNKDAAWVAILSSHLKTYGTG